VTVNYYKQCTLRKTLNPTTTRTQVAWIPEKYASEGKVIKIRNEDDQWDDGWVVLSNGDTKRSEKQLPDYHAMIKGHRKKTGDALPKNQ